MLEEYQAAITSTAFRDTAILGTAHILRKVLSIKPD